MKRLSSSLRAILALAVLYAAPMAIPVQAQQTIQQAVTAGKLVTTSIEGTGGSSGDSIKLKVRKGPNAGDGPVDATVPPGTKLANIGGGGQSMVVMGITGEDVGNNMVRPTSIIHLVGAAATYILEAFCAEFEKENPSEADRFTLGPPDPVVACLSHEGASLSLAAKQAAVWMYTDNITYEHMNQKFDVSASEWAAAQNVYRTCRAR